MNGEHQYSLPTFGDFVNTFKHFDSKELAGQKRKRCKYVDSFIELLILL